VRRACQTAAGATDGAHEGGNKWETERAGIAGGFQSWRECHACAQRGVADEDCAPAPREGRGPARGVGKDHQRGNSATDRKGRQPRRTQSAHRGRLCHKGRWGHHRQGPVSAGPFPIRVRSHSTCSITSFAPSALAAAIGKWQGSIHCLTQSWPPARVSFPSLWWSLPLPRMVGPEHRLPAIAIGGIPLRPARHPSP
jgi:hypothetical protein